VTEAVDEQRVWVDARERSGEAEGLLDDDQEVAR
jgi:hypothetical protein